MSTNNIYYKLKHIFLIHSHIATYSHIFFRLLPVFSDKKDSRKFLLMFNVILQQPFYFFNSFLVVVGTHFTLTSALCLLNIILLTFTLFINRRALLVLAGLFCSFKGFVCYTLECVVNMHNL